MNRGVVILMCVALAGCGAAYTSGAKAVEPGAEFTLAPGATAAVAGADVSVRFVGVTEDSRCPVDATCVWEGEVKVQLEVRIERVASEMTLREGESATAGAYRVTLVRAEPRRADGTQIAAGDYRATLKIGKAP